MSLVFFDFDGTLTTRDTILPLGFLLARAGSRKYTKVMLLMFYLALLKLRAITNHKFKERFCSLLLKDRPEDEVANLAVTFASHYIPKVSNAPVVDLLIKHARSGDQVYLVSSNFGFALSPLKKIWPVSGVVSTEAECVGGRYTGRILGRSCDGKEKLDRVLGLFGQKEVRGATAYGDSRSDRYLLGFVTRAVWV